MLKIFVYNLCIILFVFFSSPFVSLATNYGSGTYNSGLYSSNTPDTTPPSTPVASPVSGTYSSTQSINITSGGSDSIRYSNSAIPNNCSSGTLYTSPIEVSTSQSIYVLSCDSSNNSTSIVFNYIISSSQTSSSRKGGSSVSKIVNNVINNINNNPTTNPIPEKILKRNISLKSKGSDVKSLQIYLNTHGYIVSKSGVGSPGKESDYFGPLTKKAVIAFQKFNKLVPDGIVGPKTIELINRIR